MSAPEIDAVLSYHLNPFTCGVAKFNHQLAQKLGVPLAHLWQARFFRYPLLSIKRAELPEDWPHWPTGAFNVLWHDAGIPEISKRAANVWYATDTGCPSTLQGNSTRGVLNILSFGMAHKVQAPNFECLKALLDETPGGYTISISTGIHEGSPWEDAFAENIALMRQIFGSHLRSLGFLADDALAKELREVQAVALFFDPAARANNTSLWAALEAGTPVITNLDKDSPKELQHNVSVFNLAQLTEWPDASQCREVRRGGQKAAEMYGWDRLLATLQDRVTV